jgi:hypothetical protein
VVVGGAIHNCILTGMAGKQIHVINIAITGQNGSTYGGGCTDVTLSGVAGGGGGASAQHYVWCLGDQDNEDQLIVPFAVPAASTTGGTITLSVGAVGDANSLIGISIAASVY